MVSLRVVPGKNICRHGTRHPDNLKIVRKPESGRARVIFRARKPELSEKSRIFFLEYLTLAGNNFFSPLRVKRPQKWSPGQSALLSDTVFGDIQIMMQKKEKTLFFLMDMSKCPQMSTISEKSPPRKIFQFSNFYIKITKLDLFLQEKAFSQN